MAFADAISGTDQPAQRRVALFNLVDGHAFSVTLSAGSEQFVGRFVRLPELRTRDYVIRFRDPEPASQSPQD